jgi:ribosomal-protein-alanine N-acetyltransferase
VGGGAWASTRGGCVSRPSLGAKPVAVTLRPAGSSDLEAIAVIERQSFGDPWSAAEFESVLSLAHTIFLVAVSGADDEIAGYVVALAVVDEAEILNVAVSPALRSNGIGGGLLDAALAEVEKRGALSVFLEVRLSNASARALYGSRRFIEVSRRKGYYRNPSEDALVMRRAGIG